MNIVKEEKPFHENAKAFKDTPGKIGLDHEKESAFFKLPSEVKNQFFAMEELEEELRTGYLYDEDREALRTQLKEGYKVFDRMVDSCIVNVERILPSEGYKDFNDELRGETTTKKAVGCDLDGDGAVKTEESNEEHHKFRR